MARDGITMDIDFVENPRWDSHYDRSAHAVAEKTKAAEKSEVFAKAIAPYDAGAHEHYRDAFVIARHRGDILLGNTDFKANWIEWGTAGSPRLHIPPFPAHAVLRRSVRMAGYRLIENPRQH